MFASSLPLAKFKLGFLRVIQIWLGIRAVVTWEKDLGVSVCPSEGSRVAAEPGGVSGRYRPASLSDRPPPSRVSSAAIYWSVCRMHGPDCLPDLTAPGSLKQAAGGQLCSRGSHRLPTLLRTLMGVRDPAKLLKLSHLLVTRPFSSLVVFNIHGFCWFSL